MSKDQRNIISFVDKITYDYFNDLGRGILLIQYLDSLFNGIRLDGPSLINLTNITSIDKINDFKLHLTCYLYKYSDTMLQHVMDNYNYSPQNI